jgi:hypothetical protein
LLDTSPVIRGPGQAQVLRAETWCIGLDEGMPSMHRTLSQRTLATGAALLVTAAAMLIGTGPADAKAKPGCAAGGVKVEADASPATVTVNDTSTRTGVPVVVTITGDTFSIAPTSTGATLDSASWCLKASTKTKTGTGTTGTSAPITNKHGTPHAIGYLVVYLVTTSTDLLNSCWDNTDNVDLLFIGPINTLHNAEFRDSLDGTCSGASLFITPTVVRAATKPAADALCISVTESAVVAEETLQFFGYSSAPADLWFCK